jgi:predicted esterase
MMLGRRSYRRVAACAIAVGALFASGVALAQEDDIDNVPSEDLRAGGNEHARYFLIGPQKPAPKEGHGLVVVLPGGSGDADFLPFVKRIYKYALPEGYLVAQPVAIKWTDDQEVIWPTEKNRVDKMKFSTEKFVSAILKDVAKKQKLNPEKVFTLSWSSSGPAAYAISLSDKNIAGSLVAMSVYKPEVLPALKNAKGKPYYLYHSSEDRVCPFHMAERAAKELEKNGAKVELKTYDGGHGWHGDVFGEIRTGIDWLEKQNPAPD